MYHTPGVQTRVNWNTNVDSIKDSIDGRTHRLNITKYPYYL
jgi:hypothetical protein